MRKGDLIFHKPSGKYGVYLESRKQVLQMSMSDFIPEEKKYKVVLHHRVCLSTGCVAWFSSTGITFLDETDKNCPGYIPTM